MNIKKIVAAGILAATSLCGFAAEIIVSGKTGNDIQKAIDSVAAQGGGKVIVPAGEYPSGTIYLKSNVELNLQKGAIIKGSTKESDYNKNEIFPENFWSVGEEWSGAHLILGYKVENVAITGEGVIDGNGSAFFGDCDEDSRFPWYKYGLKLHPLNRTWFRPGPMVAFFLCKNIRIEGVTMFNPPAWTCHIRCSDGVIIRDAKIEVDRTIANSDGFSFDCTRNVLMEKSSVKAGDDAIAIRASCRHHAATNWTDNIIVRDCDLWSCCYGIRFGIGSGTITNNVIENVRVHEAAEAAFGFTPAWVTSDRNCYIEDILIKNCTATDCVRPAEGGLAGNSKIANIRFEDCVFNTLLPVRLGNGVQASFVRSIRNTISRYKVRHHINWREREIRDKKMMFCEGSSCQDVTVRDCLPKSLGSAGILLLAFDDRNFGDWEKALPLFKKYNAHASFFISGAFDSKAIACAKKLMAGGHTIGLHGAKHWDVPDAFAKAGKDGWWKDEIATPKRCADVAYIPIHSFAYPNNKNNDETDEHLLKSFSRLRTGIRGVRPFNSTAEQAAKFKPLATDDRLFFPAVDLPKHRVIGGVILGDVYRTDIEDVLNCVRRAGEKKEVLLFTSHGISPNATFINMKTEWLEKILETAQKSGVQVLGFDDLP